MTPPLHERIRQARERAGRTQQEVATAVGVSLRTLGNWERGESIPRNRLARLEDVLGVALRDEPETAGAPETLKELVQRRMRELGMIYKGDLNIRELHRRGGGDSSWSYESARQIANGSRVNIEDSTAEIVAAAIGVPVSTVRVAAGQRPLGEPFDLPDRAAGLTAAERRLMIEVMDGLLGVGAYAEDRPDVPQQRGRRRAGAPRFDLSAAEGLRLAETGSMETEPVNHGDDTQ